jgi:hypothetical protein
MGPLLLKMSKIVKVFGAVGVPKLNTDAGDGSRTSQRPVCVGLDSVRHLETVERSRGCADAEVWAAEMQCCGEKKKVSSQRARHRLECSHSKQSMWKEVPDSCIYTPEVAGLNPFICTTAQDFLSLKLEGKTQKACGVKTEFFSTWGQAYLVG